MSFKTGLWLHGHSSILIIVNPYILEVACVSILFPVYIGFELQLECLCLQFDGTCACFFGVDGSQVA